MTNSTLYHVANASSVQHALAAIATALDRIEATLAEPLATLPADDWNAWQPTLPADDWNAWQPAAPVGVHTGTVINGATGVQIINDGDNTEIVLPKVSGERYNQRWEFADSVLQLNTALGPDEDWSLAYAKGGPMWLYLTETGRDLILQYPFSVRQQMVQDVEETGSLQDAQEMARDILKLESDAPAFGD